MEDLEISILSCLIQEPDLMKEFEIEDKYFTTQKRTWKFIKEFYKKFGTLDITLMCSLSAKRDTFMSYMIPIIEKEPVPKMIYKYKERLIEMYNENEKDKWITEKVVEETNKLILKEISTKEFKEKIEKIYKNANEIGE